MRPPRRCAWVAGMLSLIASGQTYPSPQKDAPHPPSSLAEEPVCPWLTKGSASHALGGPVSVKVKLEGASRGTCTFSTGPQSGDELTIMVGDANVPACPPGSLALVGVGTHASRCRTNASQAAPGEMISGSVRDKGFAVTFTWKSALPTSAKDAVLEQVAEQVAGDLF